MVLFLGRLAHQKGPFHFLEVARRILEKRQDVHFVIAGSGYLMQEMIHRVAAMHIGKYVHFIGFIDNKKIARIFDLADVYVMPSVSEPFGLSCLEALSCGVPVVISKQSGVAEVLHHVAQVDFWDINEMANKILALLDHRALCRAMLANTAKELEGLTWGKTADSLIDLYRSLTSARRR
jgi:glycosyltransferase involved in cell wall biosynthesis